MLTELLFEWHLQKVFEIEVSHPMQGFLIIQRTSGMSHKLVPLFWSNNIEIFYY